MTLKRKLILLQFNELTGSLMQQFMSEGLLPNFSRFYGESQVYVTDAEETGERLNPWVQWVTVQTGLSADEHGISRLDEGHRLTKPCVWDTLSEHGYRVWVCGSMNVRHAPDLNGYALPDPWSTHMAPFPPDAGLDAYFRFTRAHVQEHTNDRVPFSIGDYLRFGNFMVRHGLSAATAMAIVKQLARERMDGSRWRRAAILDKLQFDVFQSVFRRIQPDFSTFFVNSVAHMQHAYWRQMDPAPFAVKPTDADRRQYGDAIRFAYCELDGILGPFMRLAGDDVTLVLSTALSQQPCLKFEATGGKHFYRARDFERLSSFIGLDVPHRVSPVMSEQFHVYVNDRRHADVIERRLQALTVNGAPAMVVRRDSDKVVFAGIGIFEDIPKDSVLMTGDGRRLPFYELFYQADTLKSGMHHPDGSLWIRTFRRQHKVHDGKVSLRAVAPTLLTLLGVEPPKHMRVAPIEVDGTTGSTLRSARSRRKTG